MVSDASGLSECRRTLDDDTYFPLDPSGFSPGRAGARIRWLFEHTRFGRANRWFTEQWRQRFRRLRERRRACQSQWRHTEHERRCHEWRQLEWRQLEWRQLEWRQLEWRQRERWRERERRRLEPKWRLA